MQIKCLRNPVLIAKWAAVILLPAILLSTDRWRSGALWDEQDLHALLSERGIDIAAESGMLRQYVEQGKTQEMLWMLLAGASAEDAGLAQGETLMSVAAAAGQLKAMQLLKCFGATVMDARVRRAAIEHNNTQIVDYLLNSGVSAKAEDETSESPLLLAVRLGFVEVAQRLLAHGANPERGSQSTSAWMQALQDGNAQMVRMMLEQGPETLKQQKKLNTSLLLAAQQGSCDVVRVLVEFGADINVESGRKKITPLIAAAAAGRTEAVRLLQELGADVNAVSGAGQTALMLAAYHGDEAMMNALLDAGADLHASSVMGNTAILAAAKRKHYRAVHILREREQAPVSKTEEQLKREAELLNAVAENNVHQANLLLRDGAEAHVRVGEEGIPLLMLAPSIEMQDELLARGADPFATDKSGNTWVERLAVAPDTTPEMMTRVLSFGFDPPVLARAFDKFLAAFPESRNLAVLTPLQMFGVDWQSAAAALLQRVAIHGSEHHLNELLQLGVDVNLQDENDAYVTDLLPWEELGKLKMLLGRGLSDSAKTSALRRSLAAAEAGWVEMLLTHGTNPHVSDESARPIYAGLLENPADIVGSKVVACLRLLAQHGLKKESLSPTDQLLFLCASEPSGHDVAQMQQLLHAGADINAYAPQGKAPLAMALAAGAGREFIIEMLVAGANPNMGSEMSADAVARLDKELLQLLLPNGVGGNNGLLSFFLKHCPGNAVIPKLLDAKVNINAADEDGLTPLDAFGGKAGMRGRGGDAR